MEVSLDKNNKALLKWKTTKPFFFFVPSNSTLCKNMRWFTQNKVLNFVLN